MSVTKVLIVDDSVFMRSMLKSALSKAEDIEVIGTAQNGASGLKSVASLKPDVMTLDVEMPGLDGIEVLRRVMKDSPLPVVMVSTKTQRGAETTLQALQLGAVDYVAKPLAEFSEQKITLDSFRKSVVQAVRTAAASNRSRLGKSGTVPIDRPSLDQVPEDLIVAVGISAGGPATLHEMLPSIPKLFPPMVLTQHMPAEFTAAFAKRLDAICQVSVKEAAAGDVLRAGTLLVAPGDRHLRVVRRRDQFVAALDDGPKVSGFKPSVDALFESVAEASGGRAVGVVMTGMGYDGSEGVRKLRACGAATIAQDKESSIVYGMPKAAADTGCVDKVVSMQKIPAAIAAAVRRIAVSSPSLC